jgi:hypothetical protein
MKKSKVFMATGAFVLAISAIFATKANKKFTAVHTGYYVVSGVDKLAVHFSSAVLTTNTTETAAFVTVYTTNGSTKHDILRTQLRTSSGVKKLYY